MHVVTWRSFAASRFPARFIAGRRLPHRHLRGFHSSSTSLLNITPPEDPKSEDPDYAEQERRNESALGARGVFDSGLPAGTIAGNGDRQANGDGSRTKERSADHGSFTQRAQRNKPDGIPPVAIPDWFLERNVRIHGDATQLTKGALQVMDDAGNVADTTKTAVLSTDGKKSEQQATMSDSSEEPVDGAATSDSTADVPLYQLSNAVWNEVWTSASAGLSLSSPEFSESFPARKSHLKLHCPVDGGIYLLDHIVEQTAQKLGADLVRLDAQDLAQIGGDYMRESSNSFSNSIYSLGYDSQHRLSRSDHDREVDEDGMEDDEHGAMDEMEDDDSPSKGPSPMGGRGNWFSSATVIPVSFGNGMGDLKAMAEKAMASLSQGVPISPGSRFSIDGSSSGRSSPQRSPWQEQKLTRLFETLIDTPAHKRQKRLAPGNGGVDGEVHATPSEPPVAKEAASESQPSVVGEENSKTATPTIILIRDHKELNATHQGGRMLDKLIEIVQRQRKKGRPILLVGTTSSADLTPEISTVAIEHLQSEGQDTLYRNIFVTPYAAGPSGGLYDRDESRRILEINLRNIEDIMTRLATPETSAINLLDPNIRPEISSKLEAQILSFDEVHRIAIASIGCRHDLDASLVGSESGSTQSASIASAMQLLEDSDEAKADWVSKERQLQKPPKEVDRPKASPLDVRMKRLSKKCSRHERQLLGGVVNSEAIRTTFADVHAPPETIEALKTLTTLSLTRPDAFQYGVLARDKISGLLLYGPPGTGKTLLAKAVAKESGATVLEVSGSEVYDMYVGEGEKNVKAIFSLAKKLSPCVVFIDEGDAIFGSRGGGTQRNTHRELINQFLREWDGMTEHTAFIMVATNRPFDLDDAVLRRLPRRLLVDLPVEADREAILRIHLKDEALDPAVSLAKLAADTPLYSGSDLKNLAIAAALACVREENATAAEAAKAASDKDGAPVYPEKRTLAQRHFDKAMEEISASVNEDMSSLGAIRKFDEKYGDRRGRRKKQGYGFMTGPGEKEADTARVRT